VGGKEGTVSALLTVGLGRTFVAGKEGQEESTHGQKSTDRGYPSE